MVCRRPPGRASAPCRTVQSRAPRSGLSSDYATLIRDASPLHDASTIRGEEMASTLTLLPLTRRGRESTGGCQVLRFAACLTRPDGTSARAPRRPSPVESTHPQDRTSVRRTHPCYHEPEGAAKTPIDDRYGWMGPVRGAPMVEWLLAEPPHRGRGTQVHRGKSRPRRDGGSRRRARQLTSQAARAVSRCAWKDGSAGHGSLSEPSGGTSGWT